MAIVYVSPTGSGLRDGSSLENAAAVTSLNKMIANAGAGGEVRLIADQGTYQPTSQISISSGGTDGAPVTIRGVDSQGNAMDAQFAGTRAENWTPGQAEGVELFRLLGGANNLVFQDIDAKNFGNGVFRIGADIQNLTIQHVDATNVTRFVQDYVSGTNTSASVSGLTVSDVTVTGYSKGAIALGYDSSNIVIDHVTGDSQGQNGGLYITGVHLDDTVHNVVISNTEMKNSYGNGTSSDYWNGDGFTTERGVYNVLFQNTVASGNTDAGYDIKSSNTVLENTIADGNDRNYRFWSTTIQLLNGVSIDPTHFGGIGGAAHVWLANGASVDISNLTYSDSTTPRTLFDLLSGGATLSVDGTEITATDAARILASADAVIDIAPVLHAPTAIALTGDSVQENALAGTVVGSLAATDADTGDTHSFALDFSQGSTGADMFEIVGNQIVVKQGAALDYETLHDYNLTVTATDQTGLSFSQVVHIGVTDVAEIGTAAADAMTGGNGADILQGLAGNDTYTVNTAGDQVIEAAGGGTDTVLTSLASYTLGANVENLTYTGSGDFTGTGNGLANVITGGNGNNLLSGLDGTDTLNGGAGNDVLYGGAGNDTLNGGTGNDLMDGGSGRDKMTGGTGDDTYVVDGSGDSVTEKAGEGIDTVRSSVSYTLGSNVENLVLTGTATTGTGNSLDNAITGNAKNNTLNGGAGNDILDGGAGNDLLIGGQGADTYKFGLGGGKDVINTSDTDGGHDVLALGAGVGSHDLWFARSGNDLVVSIIGSSDQATVQGWFAAANNQLDEIVLADGHHLQAGAVQGLIDVMAATGGTPAALTSLTADQQQAVVGIMDTSWS
jgi:Ca2+-binding RTX toxin-like protein